MMIIHVEQQSYKIMNNHHTLTQEDYDRIHEFYSSEDGDMYDLSLLDIQSMVDDEDHEDYLDNTLELLEYKNKILFTVFGEEYKSGVYSLHELIIIDRSIISKMGREDGRDHVYKLLKRISVV